MRKMVVQQFNNQKRREKNKMKKMLSIIICLVLVLGVSSISLAQWDADDDHDVQISILAINVINVSDAAVSLTITTATPGSQPDPVTDNTSDLWWTTNNNSKRITAQLSVDYPSGITLEVQASNVSGFGATPGTPTGSYVTLEQASAKDVLTSISKTFATCDLTYQASATVVADEVTNSTSTVTYTMTD